jgi:hypothetical protein
MSESPHALQFLPCQRSALLRGWVAFAFAVAVAAVVLRLA